MNNEPINQKPNRLRALIFLKVGLFELFFVAVGLFLLFGTLNYFNILSVSDAFPNQFNWLPRQTAGLPTKSTPQNFSFVPKPSPTRIPIPPVPQKIITYSKSFIGDVLISSFIPSNISFSIQGIANSNISTVYTYSSSWVGKDKERFNPVVKYNQTQAVATRQIAIYIPQSINNLDASLSALLATKYIKIDTQAIFKCKNYLPKSKLTFCESFWEEKNGVKRGIDVSSPLFGSNESQIFYCEFHREDINYSWKSCSSEFSQTGI